MSASASANGYETVTHDDGLTVTLSRPTYAVVDYVPDRCTTAVTDATGKTTTLNINYWNDQYLLYCSFDWLKTATFPVTFELTAEHQPVLPSLV